MLLGLGVGYRMRGIPCIRILGISFFPGTITVPLYIISFIGLIVDTIGIVLFLVFLILGAIGSSILSGLLGGLYYAIHRFCASIYIVFSLIAGTTILLHIFKTRYLDYYEIVKEENEKENLLNDNVERTDEEERYDEKRKVLRV